ncbi:hypothetical protein [Vacuolonema iberomarrocanum]|uniref:hypothetical protein n=1 Tax=Vacuolonema iberomarrocanum TaxID=3454632 RepID=UPI001A0AF6FC|nr:hypothetical protein [filamentous cyanobacterium LEGE 07170]
MRLFDFPELLITQLGFVLISIYWLLKRNDELPLLISTFLLYCGSYRYWAVISGVSRGWVKLINFGFAPIDDQKALTALVFIIFGEICLVGFYMLFQHERLPIWQTKAIPFPLAPRWSGYILIVGLVCMGVTILVRNQLAALLRTGRSLGFEISAYLFLFPLALVGIATLVMCVWKLGGFRSLFSKATALFILISVASLTFAPSGRFQFLGWLVAAGVIVSANFRPRRRLLLLSTLAVVAIALFATAGALRNPANSVDLNQAAWERAFSAEDANMLDGFVLLQEVYPERLPFRLGMEHIEVLMRPIPRALWPGKPVGGYMNKLGLIDANTGFTLGISPTLFGSFYAEGWLVGIAIFSCVYGYCLAKLVVWSARLHPFAGVLIRAVICAALIPLLRGGDLPGIYAWIGMGFWPCFLGLWLNRHTLTGSSYSASSAYLTHFNSLKSKSHYQ